MRLTSLCVSAALLVLFTSSAEAQNPGAPETFTVVVAGDVGFNRNQVEVDPRGVVEGKNVASWESMTAGIKSLITGDLNFYNLETVVTERNDLKISNKNQKGPYHFRSHPKGVEHMAQIGFNLVSAANNHTYDYGDEGVRDSVRHLEALENRGLLEWAGIGLDTEQAARPAVFGRRGARIAFSAIGSLTNMIRQHRSGEKKPGSLGCRFDDDWKMVTERLGKTRAGLRILSVHYGKERDVKVDARQLRDWRGAVRNGNADLVVGHHAHVVRGVEINDGRVIFYGLGNFLIRGARNMAASPKLRLCCDYGLVGKVHFARQPNGHYRARAIEVTPVIDMHRAPKRWPVEESKKRINYLNGLAPALDNSKEGAVGVRFEVRDDGTGLYCEPGTENDPESIATLCRGFRERSGRRARK